MRQGAGSNPHGGSIPMPGNNSEAWVQLDRENQNKNVVLLETIHQL